MLGKRLWQLPRHRWHLGRWPRGLQQLVIFLRRDSIDAELDRTIGNDIQAGWRDQLERLLV